MSAGLLCAVARLTQMGWTEAYVTSCGPQHSMPTPHSSLQGGPTPEEWQETKAKIGQLQARYAQLQKDALLLAGSLGQMSGGTGGQPAAQEEEDWRAC